MMALSTGGGVARREGASVSVPFSLNAIRGLASASSGVNSRRASTVVEASRLNGEDGQVFASGRSRSGSVSARPDVCVEWDEATSLLLRASQRQLQRALAQNSALSDGLRFCLAEEDRLQAVLKRNIHESSVAALSYAEAVQARDELKLKVQELEEEVRRLAQTAEEKDAASAANLKAECDRSEQLQGTVEELQKTLAASEAKARAASERLEEQLSSAKKEIAEINAEWERTRAEAEALREDVAREAQRANELQSSVYRLEAEAAQKDSFLESELAAKDLRFQEELDKCDRRREEQMQTAETNFSARLEEATRQFEEQKTALGNEYEAKLSEFQRKSQEEQFQIAATHAAELARLETLLKQEVEKVNQEAADSHEKNRALEEALAASRREVQELTSDRRLLHKKLLQMQVKIRQAEDAQRRIAKKVEQTEEAGATVLSELRVEGQASENMHADQPKGEEKPAKQRRREGQDQVHVHQEHMSVDAEGAASKSAGDEQNFDTERKANSNVKTPSSVRSASRRRSFAASGEEVAAAPQLSSSTEERLSSREEGATDSGAPDRTQSRACSSSIAEEDAEDGEQELESPTIPRQFRRSRRLLSSQDKTAPLRRKCQSS